MTVLSIYVDSLHVAALATARQQCQAFVKYMYVDAIFIHIVFSYHHDSQDVVVLVAFLVAVVVVVLAAVLAAVVVLW